MHTQNVTYIPYKGKKSGGRLFGNKTEQTNPWEKYFNSESEIIRSACPLRKFGEHQYGFIHQRLFSLEVGEYLLFKHKEWVYTFDYREDHGRLVTGCKVDLVVWDIVSGDSVQFSPDGQYVVSGSRDNTIWIWSIDTGTCLSILRLHDGLMTISYSANSRLMVGFLDCLDFNLM